MEKVILQPTNETPYVEMDPAAGKFHFAGKSYPENVHDFYSPILQDIQGYVQVPSPKTTLEFKWLYYNTASAKIIVRIITELRKVKETGNQLEIKWICKANDDLIIEKGEELKELLDVDFEIVNV